MARQLRFEVSDHVRKRGPTIHRTGRQREQRRADDDVANGRETDGYNRRRDDEEAERSRDRDDRSIRLPTSSICQHPLVAGHAHVHANVSCNFIPNM